MAKEKREVKRHRSTVWGPAALDAHLHPHILVDLSLCDLAAQVHRKGRRFRIARVVAER